MENQDIIGFIGLGNIGLPIAERILAHGFDLVVWNRSPEKARGLIAAGARGVGSARELGEQVDVLFTCLSGTVAMEEVCFGPGGIAGDGMRVSLIVDLSTVPPQFEVEMGRRLKRQSGMDLIDVPVSGGVSGARSETLAAMAGGEANLLERARPVIASFANRITHMGPLGAGQATKACNQVISLGTMGAIAEAIALGNLYGIDTWRLPTAVSGGFGDSEVMRELGRSQMVGDSSSVRAIIEALARPRRGASGSIRQETTALVSKDLGIALDMGRALGGTMPLTTLMERLFRAAISQPD